MDREALRFARRVAVVALGAVLAFGLCMLYGPREALADSALTGAGVGPAAAEQPTTALDSAAKKAPHVEYKVHEESYGWMKPVQDGKVAGVTGKSLRTEALRVTLDKGSYKGGIKYRSYGQNSGWSRWVANGAMTGTTGKGLRLEAIQVKLTGEIANDYDVYYCAHVQGTGWMGWAKNGAKAGTFGKGYRIEALKIQLVKKGEKAPGPTANAFSTAYLTDYSVFVQSLGWKYHYRNGEQAGTTGAGLRLESFALKVADLGFEGNVIYRAHIQGTGWGSWRANGEEVGKAGSGLRIEALQIELSGQMDKKFDIYYRTYCEKYGWLGWAKNGQTSGTTGYGYRAEAVEVKLVKEGGKAPGPTRNHEHVK